MAELELGNSDYNLHNQERDRSFEDTRQIRYGKYLLND